MPPGNDRESQVGGQRGVVYRGQARECLCVLLSPPSRPLMKLLEARADGQG